MKLTNTGTGAVLLNIGDGIEIAGKGHAEVDAKAWAALKSNPVVASWVADGRIIEEGAAASEPAPVKAKKAPAKDAE